jgi:hypothetical protein
MRPRILFVGGSFNQTSMLHAVSRHLEEQADCYFTPHYAHGLLGRMAAHGLLEFTILGGRHRQDTEAYLQQVRLKVDYGGMRREYDLVVTGSDALVPPNLRGRRIVLVQEGMIEPAGWMFQAVRILGLPRYLANTATTGLSDAYTKFCVASEGFRQLFVARGVRPEKIEVTGIPNFDDVESYRHNDFPERGYVLVATSNGRETFKRGDRPAFLRRAVQLAAGRPMIFKLHPAETFARARAEIEAILPGARVLTSGNTNHMIANCEMLVAEHSSVIFIGLALDKPLHAELDLAGLRRLIPLQNGGRSAQAIADVCRQVVNDAEPATSRRGWLRRASGPSRAAAAG